MTERSLARQLTWRRHGTAWRLFVGRRRFGDVDPIANIPECGVRQNRMAV